MERYIPIGLFCSLFIKLAIQGSTYTDAVVLAISAALVIFQEIKLKNKQISELKHNIADLKDSQKNIADELQILKNYVSSQKMNSLRVKPPNVG